MIQLQNQVQDLTKKLELLTDVFYTQHFIDKEVFMNKVYFQNTVYLPTKIAFFGSQTPISKQAAITPPSGGATIDSEARTAINTIITRLQSLGLTL